MLASIGGKALWQAFWPQLEHSPLLPLALPKPHTLGMTPDMRLLQVNIHPQGSALEH